MKISIQVALIALVTTHCVLAKEVCPPELSGVKIQCCSTSAPREMECDDPKTTPKDRNFLGSGTFGSVYEARWGCQKCAAMTFFDNQSDLYEEEIQKEITFLKRFRHRNIVQFYRTHKLDGHIYLIMELAEKGTLAKAINESLLDWPTKTRLAHEIARGLEYIHQENVLHRDLKSANVLLTRHMEAKLAGFGFAQIRSTVRSSLSISSTREGITETLGWIAPELFETDKPPYTTKTDIYALGMVMWEMAANCTRPYKDQDNRALIVHHVKNGYRERLPDDTPIVYREWVERCWHHNPNQRPDASEVILVRDHQDVADDDNGAVLISFTSSNDENTNTNKEDNPIAVNHPNSATSPGRLPHTDNNVVQYYCKEAQQGNRDAQLFLGWIYRQDGEFVKKNVEDSAWWYRKAADQGDATAQFILGETYENGQGVDASDVQAVTWYRNAAVHGVAKAQVNLGEMYEEGRGVRQDDAEALKWYHMAADQGQDNAQVKMGTWYSLGRGVDQNDHEAVKWFTKAAQQRNASAQNSLGMMYLDGQGVEQNDVEAFKWFTLAAEQGYAEAQNNLGWMYRVGHGVEQSYDEAVRWFTKAAQQGYADAQNNLGRMYSQGRGVEKSDVEAVKWLTKAVEQGSAAAQNNLGWMYKEGRGVDQSDTEAVKWYTHAAKQGYAAAQNNLGRMYSQGRGVEKSDVKAVKWYIKAAQQGSAAAQNNLGWMYKEGRGVENSDAEAVKWYAKAAEQGYASAQNSLGWMYAQGRGVERSDIEAIKWYTKAAQQGSASAQNNLGWMYKKRRGVTQSNVEDVK
ncbi:hypothetical protein BGW42_000048 [Actinomortierella wolfii]|nr:hypothetical protein BGW42_000048 [Actinomortierella wolfii]